MFTVLRGEIESRFDCYYYDPKFRQAIDFIHNSRYEIVKVKNITNKVTDGTHYTPNYLDNGVHFISVKDIQEYHISFDDTKYISLKEHNFLIKRCKPEKNDILLTKIGSIGRATVIRENLPEFSLFVSVALLKPKPDLVNSNYLALFCNSKWGKIQFERALKGIGVPDLHLENIKEVEIPLPSLPIQKEIVNKLNKSISEKQTKEKEAKELLSGLDDYLMSELEIKIPPKEEKNIFFTNLLLVKGSRLDPYFHQKHFNKFEQSLLNGKYKVKRLKFVSLKITSGATPLSGSDAYTLQAGIPFVRSGNINVNGYINFDKLLYIKREIHERTLRSSQLAKNDLLIAIVGATIGQVGLYTYDREANINQAIAVVRFKNTISPEFAKEYMSSAIGQAILDRLKRPVARANINLDEIASIPICIPPLEKQKEIAKYLKAKRDRAFQLQKEAKENYAQAKQEIENMIIKTE